MKKLKTKTNDNVCKNDKRSKNNSKYYNNIESNIII
jgi:hypothetical protein